MSSSDGLNFPSSSKVKLGETSFVGPALTYGSAGSRSYPSYKLYIAWTGTDNVIRVMSSSDGVNFPYSQRVTLAETSSVAPAAAVFGCANSANCINKLNIAWTGTDSVLRIMSSSDGLNFPYADRLTLSETSYVAPALTVNVEAPGYNRLYFGWTGTDSIVRIMSSWDGKYFDYRTTLSSMLSYVGPAIERHSFDLKNGTYSAWTDKSGRINVGRIAPPF
jgi:hypothetical protein